MFIKQQIKQIFRAGVIFKIFFIAIFLFGLFVQSIAQKDKDSILNIGFGHSDTICYNLTKGTYSVLFKKNRVIRDASAYTKGEQPLKSNEMKFAGYTVVSINDSIGQGRKYTVSRTSAKNLQMQQVFYVYDGLGYFIVQTIVSGSKVRSNYICSLHSNEVVFNDQKNMLALKVPFDNDMWVKYTTAPINTVHFTSSEVSSIYNTVNHNGLIIGSLEHECWKSGIKITSGGDQNISLDAFAGLTDSVITHDRQVHGMVCEKYGNVSLCRSPKMMVGYFKDWRTGMEIYGKNNRLIEPPFIKDWTRGTPVGWNSWGVLKDEITLNKAKGVVDFFYDSCKLFRSADNTLYIDLDSYWDKMITRGVDGGLNGDNSELKAFVDYCIQKGFRPGIYWAPFTDWGKTNSVVEGSNYHYEDCWTRAKRQVMDIDGGRAMDPTHPATKARIKYYADFFKRLGFEMIKIDFLAHATLEADSFYDKNVHTGMQAFKEGMEFLDTQLGNKMLIYAAISPTMATARYVHMRRIACDAFKNMNETAYTLNSVKYGWWLGQMYNYLDADHVVFFDASQGENRARLTSAIVTGSLITGDDYDSAGRWKIIARELLQNPDLLKITSGNGKPFQPLDAQLKDNTGTVFTKQIGKELYVALFNYSNQPVQINIPIANLKIPWTGKWTSVFGGENQNIQQNNSTVVITLPPKDAAVWKYGRAL